MGVEGHFCHMFTRFFHSFSVFIFINGRKMHFHSHVPASWRARTVYMGVMPSDQNSCKSFLFLEGICLARKGIYG